MNATKITTEQLTRMTELTAMNDKYRAAWTKYASHSRSGSCATLLQQSRIDAECGFRMTNELRAELETLVFLSSPAQKEFVYPLASSTSLTGWIGNILMQITWAGREFRSAFCDNRQCIRARGINGAEYYGTVYGTYARMTPRKTINS